MMTCENPYEQYLLQNVHYSKSEIKFINAMEEFLRNGTSFNDISVTGLCSKAHSSRTTFYYYYSSPRDVLEQYEDLVIWKVFSRELLYFRLNTSAEDSKKSLEREMRHMLKIRDELAPLMLIHSPDYAFVQKWKNMVKYRFFPFVKDSPDREFALEMFSTCVFWGTVFFLKNEPNYSFETYLESVHQFYVFTLNGMP